MEVLQEAGKEAQPRKWSNPTRKRKPNEAILLHPSEAVGILAILGEFWSWEHPQPTSKGRNLSEAKDMAAQMTTKSLLK